MCVRGLKRSTGKFEGYDYDNIICHCLAPDDGKMLAGEPVQIEKVPYVVFKRFCDAQGISMEDVVGLDIRFLYNKFAKVEEVVLA